MDTSNWRRPNAVLSTSANKEDKVPDQPVSVPSGSLSGAAKPNRAWSCAAAFRKGSTSSSGRGTFRRHTSETSVSTMAALESHRAQNAVVRCRASSEKGINSVLPLAAKRRPRSLRKGCTDRCGLSASDLVVVAEILRLAWHEEGLIADRRHHMTTYQRSFQGVAAVEWLLSNGEADTQQQAVNIMRLLEKTGHVHHVSDDQTFCASKQLYRFRRDDGTLARDVVDLQPLPSMPMEADKLINFVHEQCPSVIRDVQRKRIFYPQCMVAQELVDAIVVHMGGSRVQAVGIGRRLLQERVIVNVDDMQPSHFSDSGEMLVRFYDGPVKLDKNGKMKLPLARLNGMPCADGKYQMKLINIFSDGKTWRLSLKKVLGLVQIESIDSCGTSVLAGLKKGDYILAVNNKSVMGMSHVKVKKLLDKSLPLASLLVGCKEGSSAACWKGPN